MTVKLFSANEQDTNTPKPQLWIYRILFLRILFFVTTLSITIYVLSNNITTGFLSRISDLTLINYLKNNSGNPFDNVPNVGGFLFGENLLLFIVFYFEFYTLKAKKVAGFWIAWVFDLLFVLSYPFLPIMPLIILILKISPSVIKRFQNTNNHSEELLDDIL